ncbi:MAG: DNA alkylation repair protein, partial [Gammaproteobacteria bacterium]
NTRYINNWDLVDSSAHKIIGVNLLDKNKSPLYKLAKSKDLWERRIAIISTLHFIKNQKFEDTLEISKQLLNDKEDLIHKAVGWMLREIGKQAPRVERNFLHNRYRKMPRTMLRYAIEKFPDDERKKYLLGTI